MFDLQTATTGNGQESSGLSSPDARANGGVPGFLRP
jgi:hypothetical protein